MNHDRPDRARELESLLDEVSFQLTTARSAGLVRTNELRAALRRARTLIADADNLAAAVSVERKRAED